MSETPDLDRAVEAALRVCSIASNVDLKLFDLMAKFAVEQRAEEAERCAAQAKLGLNNSTRAASLRSQIGGKP